MEQQLQQERIVIENDDEIEIDLKDLVLEILSFWKWVLFALIIGAVTAYCISRFVMVPQYESTSQFYVLSKSMSITSLADIQTGTSLTNDYMVIVEGRPVLEQVIENLGLDETYSSLKKKVTLNNPSNSRILACSARGPLWHAGPRRSARRCRRWSGRRRAGLLPEWGRGRA